MGLIAGAAVGALAAGGAAALSASEQNDAAQNQASYQNASSKQAAAYAKTQAKDQKFNNGLYGGWLKNLTTSSQAFGMFLKQQKSLPRLAAFTSLLNKTDNTAFQDRLNSVAPGLLPALKANSDTLNAYAKGEVPDDVKGLIARESAQRALMGGYGPSGGSSGPTRMAEDDYARNFGLTSMALKDKAQAMLPGVLNAAAAVNPSNLTASSLLFSPQALADKNDQRRYGDVVKNMKVTPGYVNTTPVQANTVNPWAHAAVAAGQSLGSSLMSGGMGGGGGSGGRAASADPNTGMYNSGFYNSAAAAQQAGGAGAVATAFRPGQYYISSYNA